MKLAGKLPHDADLVRRFILSGRARFTLIDERTGGRWAFKISKSSTKLNVWLANYRVRSDRFFYMGQIHQGLSGKLLLVRTHNSLLANWNPKWVDLERLITGLNNNCIPAGMQIWHEGRCGKCNRVLVDGNITGIGECCSSRAAE